MTKAASSGVDPIDFVLDIAERSATFLPRPAKMPHSFSPRLSLRQSLRKLVPYVSDQGRGAIGVVCLAVVGATLAASEPLLLKRLFDRFLGSSGIESALAPFVALTALLVLREALAFVQDRLFWRVRLGVNFRLLEATMDRLHALPLSFHREESVGATMTKVERGISGVMLAFTDAAVQILPALIYLGMSIIVMLHIDARLSLVVLVFGPLPAVVGAFAAKEQTVRERALMQRWTRIFARFNEVLAGIVVVKSFVREDEEKRRFLGGVQDANGIVLSGVKTDSRVNATKNAIMILARLVALGLGGALVMNHQITLGTLLAFVSYLGGLFQPIQTLTGTYATMKRASASVEAVLSILDAEDTLRDVPDARDMPQVRGEVEFRDVTFGYHPDVPVLKRFDLCVKPGEVVALVGPSGAGKSTVMALLQRLYDPDSGAILVDGQNVRSFKQRSLRGRIGVVLQDGVLFSDTIRENIAFGKPGATLAEVEAVARAANAHDFIMALPEGYDTPAGERGAKLSGGERQRIAIARTLLKDTAILILDEATSALDAENEEKIQEALGRLTRGKTTFIVAHRLTTVLAADRIVVFKDGAILETGNHRTLMEQDGYYASLVRRQSLNVTPGPTFPQLPAWRSPEPEGRATLPGAA
jgi:ATP-binding cassette subfamily B protein